MCVGALRIAGLPTTVRRCLRWLWWVGPLLRGVWRRWWVGPVLRGTRGIGRRRWVRPLLGRTRVVWRWLLRRWRVSPLGVLRRWRRLRVVGLLGIVVLRRAAVRVVACHGKVRSLRQGQAMVGTPELSISPSRLSRISPILLSVCS